VNDHSKYFVTKEDIVKATETRERFRQHFLKAPVDKYDQQWDALWEQDFLPWDKLCASPALVDLMESVENQALFNKHTTKRALVPGCGRGYDAYLFAVHGYKSVGMDISKSAIDEAKKWIASELADHEEKGLDVSKFGTIDCVHGDFFADEWMTSLGIPTKGAFELVYDYAFLVAMNPISRAKWAARMAELITPGVGLLICLEYPLFRDPRTGGPPHAIRSWDYDRLLREKFEKIQHYMPERTHEVGIGSDMVSVWRRKAQ